LRTGCPWIVIILLILPQCVLGQDNFGIRPVTQLFDSWSSVSDFVFVEDYAIVATNTTGLRIVDISDPENPHEVGKVDENISTEKLYQEGNWLFVDGSRNSFSVFDISNPAEIELLAEIPLREVTAIAVRDSIAFVGQQVGMPFARGLRILNIRDLENPISLGFYDLNEGPNDIAISGEIVYLSVRGSGFYIIDVSNLSEPRLLSHIEIAGRNTRSVKLVGNIAYLICASFGLYLIDIEDPENPEIISHFDAWTLDVVSNDTITYVATRPGIQLLDVSDPQNLRELGFCESGGSDNRIYYREGLVITGNEDSKLKFFDVSDPNEPSLINSMQNNEYVTNVEVSDNTAFILSSTMGDPLSKLMTVDIQDIENPVLAGTLNLEDLQVFEHNFLNVQDDYVYITSFEENGMQIIDAHDRDNPEYVGSHFEGGRLFQPVFEGNNAYISQGNSQALKIDISDPENPIILDTIQFPGRRVTIESVNENIAVTFNDDPVGIWDIEDVNSPELLSTIDLYNIQYVVQSDDLLYIRYEYQFQSEIILGVYDISNPDQPERVAEYQSDDVYGLYFSRIIVENNHIYSMGSDSRLFVLDVSDPAHMRVVGMYWTPGVCRDMDVQDGIVYITNTYSLNIYDCSEALTASNDINPQPSTFSLISAYPNPFNSTTTISYEVLNHGNVSLQLYNPFGQRVSTLFEGNRHAGFYSTGMNANHFPSGSYFLKFETSGQVITQKVTLIR